MKLTKRLLLITLLLCINGNVFGCGKNNQGIPSEEQQRCKHEWHAINLNRDWTYNIYCPKCHLEKVVNNKEWRRIQIDMEYENKKGK